MGAIQDKLAKKSQEVMNLPRKSSYNTKSSLNEERAHLKVGRGCFHDNVFPNFAWILPLGKECPIDTLHG